LETAHGINAATGASRCKTCSTAGSSHASPDAGRGYAAIVACNAGPNGFA